MASPLRRNYDLEFKRETDAIRAGGERPRLFLHVCCAPCGTTALSRLTDVFDITLLYYNPNIFPRAEHDKRLDALRTLLSFPQFSGHELIVPEYNHEAFTDEVRGLEAVHEGGARCTRCYWIRLEYAAKLAHERGIPYLTTSLTVGPHKDAEMINTVGFVVSAEHKLTWLAADFKKRNGYRNSVRISRELGIYRQNHCGCEFA